MTRWWPNAYPDPVGKKGWIVAIVVAIAAVAGAAWLTIAAVDPHPSSLPCADQLKVDESKVHTTRWDPATDLPDLGEYFEIHWQAHAVGNPCLRAPGPTDWMYEGVVQLRPDTVRALAGKYEWHSVTDVASLGPDGPQVWQALASFVTTGTRWMHSDAYDQAPLQSRWRHLYLDPDHAVAMFVLHDH
jgi:hypothetical protein